MCMSSILASVMAAGQNDLNPSIGRVIRLTRPMVLLDNIIDILDLWPEASHLEFDARFLFNLVAFYSRGIGATLIEGDLFRQTRLIDRIAKEAQRRFAVGLGSQEEVNRSACFVDRSIQVFPLTFDAHIRLVQGLAYGVA